MDYINVENDCDLNSEGLVPWMIIRAGQPSKFKEIRMVGNLYDKNGQEILGGGGGGITEYSTLFVNSLIPASAPPVYKTFTELATVVMNNPTISYDVKLMTDVTVSGLVEFTDTTRLIGVGENRRIIINDNGIINGVSEFIGIRFEINATVIPANVFNNAIPKYTFTNCTFADGGTKNIPVFILLGGELIFNNCTLLGFLGPNKNFIANTIGLLDVTFTNTTLPQAPVCTFAFTDPTIGNVNIKGASTDKLAIRQNCLGNYRVNIYHYLEDHTDVIISNPETTHTLMYDAGDGNWKNRKIATTDVSDINVNAVTLSGAMGLTYDAGNNQWTNNYTSESATVYTFFYDPSGEPITQVPQGQVAFLNFGNQTVDNTISTAKVWVSYLNQSGVNLKGTGFLEGINRPGNKYQILVKYLLDSGEYLRANIIDSVENDLLGQWELLVTTPSVFITFADGNAIAISIEHYPLLEKLLDVGIANPVSGQVLQWDGSLWTNASSGGGGSVAWNDVTDKPTTFPPEAHQHVLADISDFSVATDGITVTGTGVDSWNTKLSTNEYSWKFGGVYNGSLPTMQNGEFWIDIQHTRLVFRIFDALGIPHHWLLHSIEYGSQIIIVFPNKVRNRYTISSIVSSDADYVEYVFNGDQKPTVAEEFPTVGITYQIQFLYQPISNLDSLSDVVITNPSEGEVVQYNSGSWKNMAPDFPVTADDTTVKGTGTVSLPLKTNSYTWTYAGIYNHSAPPHLNPGFFVIDPDNRYLLFHHLDNNSVSHHTLLLSMEFLSQIVLKFSPTLRNRYCIEQYTDDVPNEQIEFSWQNDIKLTVLEQSPLNLELLKSLEIEFIRTPGINLDALADVAITNPTDGQLLEYDTLLGWQNATVPYLPLGTTSTLYQGDVIAYDDVNNEWRNSDNVIPIWKDLYGLVSIRGNQGNPPSLQACDANSKFYEYATANNGLTDMYFEFHINHDYKLGSDTYFHVHHMTNTNLNGNLRVDFTADVTLAQLSYSGSTNPSNSKFFQESGGAVTLATMSHTYDATPQYRHVVTEVQLSSNGGSATTLDSAKINVDSLILIRLRRNAGAGTDTATNNYVFVLQSDIHFQSSRIGTYRRTYDTNTFSFLV